MQQLIITGIRAPHNKMEKGQIEICEQDRRMWFLNLTEDSHAHIDTSMEYGGSEDITVTPV